MIIISEDPGFHLEGKNSPTTRWLLGAVNKDDNGADNKDIL